MNRSIIFLYTSWRTGGTALAAALRSDESLMLFYDPLNQGLMNFEFAEAASSETWNSNHPSDFKYFDEYLPLFIDGRLENFPDLSEYKFRSSSITFQNQLIAYLSGLVATAKEKGKSAVFKFEQLEGHLDLLKEHFPSAIHIGLIRDKQRQFDSWLEQLALGSSGFFDAARRLILGDPDFFMNGSTFDNPTNEQVFELYHSQLMLLSSKYDLTLNIYEDNRDEFLSKNTSDFFQQTFSSAFRRLDELEKPPTFEKKFIRMTARALELAQQRDELAQQRDEVFNSTIWRATKPLRSLINVTKR